MTSQPPLMKEYFIPETEGIKYAGSKLKLIPNIIELVKEITPDTIFDGFSGTTRVAQAFAKLGYQVVTNDKAVWSKVFGQCYLQNKRSGSYYKDLISHLNSLPGKDGWFTEHYGGFPNGGISTQDDGLKKPWQIHNTRKLDAIIDEIENTKLDKIERSVALTSLILALDKVDNTMGHYASYLREWSARSFNKMVLKVPMLFRNKVENRVIHKNIFDVLDEVEVDLAYYDPPYGSNNEKMPPSRVRYAAYYHLWKTICLNDKPELFGKVGRRVDTRDNNSSSVFEEYRRNERTGKFIVVEAIDKLLKGTKAKHIILSYSSGGRATATELNTVIEKNGDLIKTIKINHSKNVMASMTWTNEWVDDAEEPHKEFLFLIER